MASDNVFASMFTDWLASVAKVHCAGSRHLQADDEGWRHTFGRQTLEPKVRKHFCVSLDEQSVY